jgi:hypothetical protein
MNINIEKITNGFVVTIDGTKTFCDVPEAICGLTSEWVLKYCDELEKPKKAKLALSQYAIQKALAQQIARLDTGE